MPGLAAIVGSAPFSVRVSRHLDDAVTTLCWTADGERLYLGSAAGELCALSATGEPLHSWRGHDGGVTRVCPRPGNSSVLATAGEDGQVKLWDTDTWLQQAMLVQENDWVEQLAWTPDGELLASAARKTISLWRDADSLGMWYDARRHVLAMAWAPDSRRLATAANKGLYLWRMDHHDAEAAEPVQLLTFPGAPVSVAWQPRGKALAVGTQDGFLQVWRPGDASRGAKQLTMRGYTGKVNCLAWHPTLSTIATAGGNDVVLWELPRGVAPARGTPLRHHQHAITALAWSDDGRMLASADRGGRLCIWGANHEAIYSQQLGREVSALQWQPGRALLSVGDTSGTLSLIDQNPSKDES